MKYLHWIAGALLVLAGLLHFMLFLIEPGDPNKAVYLVYGCLYLFSGLVFFTKRTWIHWPGLLFPLSGMILGFLSKGFTTMGPLMGFLLILDLVVIGCCTVLLLYHRNKLRGPLFTILCFV